MDRTNQDTEKKAIEACLDALRQGKLMPWKVEEEAAKHGVVPPDNYRTAALCRQKHIEEHTGEEFREIRVTEKPLRQFFRCHKDNLTWELDALDTDWRCSLCGSTLEPLNRHGPLVASISADGKPIIPTPEECASTEISKKHSPTSSSTEPDWVLLA